MSIAITCDPSLAIPPPPVPARFVPARRRPRHAGLARRLMRDFTAFLALSWAAAELALWAGGV